MTAQIRLQEAGITYPLDMSKSFKASLKSALNSAKREPKVKGIPAINDLTLELNSGDRLGVYGKNGSGKTTLLKLLAGIYEPTAGKIIREGRISSFIDLAAGMDNELSGIDAIYLKSLYMGIPRKQIKENLDEIIAFSELGVHIHYPLRTYSSGMWARLAFSVATQFDAEILILDEWLSVGDKSFNDKAQKRLESLVDKSSIFIMASHNLDLLKSTCSKIIYMDTYPYKIEDVIDNEI